MYKMIKMVTIRWLRWYDYLKIIYSMPSNSTFIIVATAPAAAPAAAV
jgi:hypothetical protein